MSEGEKRRGLHPLAWVGIGCGVIVLIGIIMVAAGVGFVVNKTQDFIADAKERPVETAARAFALASPELEFVSADEQAKRATLRNVDNGEEITVDLEDLKEGNLRLESSSGGAFELGRNDAGDPSLSVRSGDGSTFEASTAVELPGWLELPPGAEAGGGTSRRGPQGRAGNVSFMCDDSVADVVSFYEELAAAGGMEVSKSLSSAGAEGESGLVRATHEDGRSMSAVVGKSEGRTAVVVSFEDPVAAAVTP